ncbi:AAEL009321-PA [Aedes aegypti]|uniref:AAEL009321-PA n=1 Tax=Aedes aegypti TaxID=7159 RepID=Q16W57_AEDAE|nr:AAEL009321-PA [Aedes aegypti]
MPTEKRIRKKRIVILEPHEEPGVDKTREKSIRESVVFNSNSNRRRQSTKSDIFGSLMMSSGFPSMPSRHWTSQRRTTMYMSPRFRKTYRLESSYPFDRDRVQHTVDRYLSQFLTEHRYNPRRAKRLAENLSVELRNMVKRFDYQRYRVVAVVTIGDKQSQDFRSVARFVWDAEKDGYVNFAYEAAEYFLTATVFAVYYE